MKKRIGGISLAVVSMGAVLTAFTAQAQEDLQSRSQQAISNFEQTDSTLRQFLDQSAGYAVFPDIGKGGLIVGGARGKGLLFERGAVTGQVTMTQASIGAQAGGQSYAEIIAFETPAALQTFKAGDFKLRADLSAVAVTEGASKTARFQEGVSVFTLPKKGLMVQASVGGQKFKFEPLAATGR